MDAARVGGEERSGEAAAAQFADETAEPSGRRRPFRPRPPAARQRAERIEAERQIETAGIRAASFGERRDGERLILGRRTEIEFDRRAGVEAHAVEQRVERSGVRAGEAVAVSAAGAGERQVQPVGAVGEIVERLSVGARGVGMVDARQHAPAAALARGARTGAAGVERLDGEGIVAARNQLFEGAPFQRALDELQPLTFADRRKIPRQVRHIRPDRDQMNCDSPGMAADISPTTSSPASSRA